MWINSDGMRKFIFLYTWLFLIFGIISCNPYSGKNEEGGQVEKTFLVGANLTLTGNAAHWGVQLRDGLEYGFGKAEDLLDSGKVILIAEDNQLNTREAVSIAKRFTDVDRADLMISAYTPVVKSIISIAEQKGIPMLATLTSATEVAKGKNWVFRDFTPETINMPMIAQYAFNKEGFRKGAWLVVNDDFGRDAMQYFEQSFTGLGGTFSNGEYFETSDLDLRNKVEKILASEPEFILLIGRGSAMINACRQIRETEKDMRIYSAAGIDNDRIWQGLGPDANGIVYGRIVYDTRSAEFMRINEDFKSVYGYDMTWVNIYGYSIAHYVTAGFASAGKDKNKLRDYFKTLDHQSIRGRLVMDENSDVLTPVQLYIMEDGISRPVE